MKAEMPKPYISWSQFWLFQNDPSEYYLQYYIGRIDRRNSKMTLGSIFQLAWCDKKYNYAEELTKEGFTSNYIRIMKTALEHKHTLKVEKKFTEKQIQLTKKETKAIGLKYPILGVFDGFHKEGKLLIENKFGMVWSKERAEEDRQLTWYSLVIHTRYGFLPRIALQSFNSKTGIPTVIWTKRSRTQLNDLKREINNMVALVQASDFEKKD